MILTTTTQKLQVFLAGAITTSNCPINIDYVDFTSTTTTPGMTSVNTVGVTTTDILAAPAASTQRKVNGITLFNADTAAVVVTIQINNNATLYPVVSAMTIPVGGTLQYTDRRGWSVIPTNGGIKTTKPALVQEFLANGTWTKPGGVRFAMVECVGGGGGGGGLSGSGGGGAKRNRFLFLTKDLPTTVSVVVAAGGTCGTSADGGQGGTSTFGAYLSGYGGGPGIRGLSINSPAYGGGGGGGTSSGVNTTGGSAMAAGAGANTSTADHSGAGGGSFLGPGSFLGGAGGGGCLDNGCCSFTYSGGGYSWFSAGGGGAYASYGGGCGTTTISSIPAAGLSDVLGCGTGGGSGSPGGFPGGGGGSATNSTAIGGAGVVRVWCW